MEMPMDIDKCRLESSEKWANVNLEMQKIKDELVVMKARLDKQAALVADIQQLSTSVAVLANNMQDMLKEQQRLATKIETLESKPGKRWDAIIEKAILMITAALVGALLLKLGLPV